MIREPACFHRDEICNCETPKRLFYPMFRRVPQRPSLRTESLTRGRALVRSHSRPHPSWDDKGFIKPYSISTRKSESILILLRHGGI